jgi:hypothetical protein
VIWKMPRFSGGVMDSSEVMLAGTTIVAEVRWELWTSDLEYS